MSQIQTNFAWAIKLLSEGKAITRENGTWKGAKVFKTHKRTCDTKIEKSHPYGKNAQGQIIVAPTFVQLRQGVISPWIPSSDDYAAEDYQVAK